MEDGVEGGGEAKVIACSGRRVIGYVDSPFGLHTDPTSLDYLKGP